MHSQKNSFRLEVKILNLEYNGINQTNKLIIKKKLTRKNQVRSGEGDLGGLGLWRRSGQFTSGAGARAE